MGNATLEQAIQKPWPKLDVLPAGTIPANPAEVLNATQAQKILNEVSTQYDLVILDCPPSIKLSNIQVISTLVDGMFIVYAMNQTKKEALAFTAQALLQVSAPLCGLIANHVVPHTLDQYGYYDHISRYHDGPGDTTHAVEDKSAVREDGLSDSKRKNKHQQQ